MNLYTKNLYNATDVNSTFNENLDTFDQLLPTLVECFLIVFCGYLAGRFKFIPKEESKGMNYFTANLAMPAMIFLNLASLDFRDVNWNFFAAILTSKALIFLFVIFLTSVVRRPVNLSIAAIYAIFATHVNDFGLGYPIFNSLYARQNPMYPGYIYLIGQISLVILNPIAFVFMEVERTRQQDRLSPKNNQRFFKIVLKVMWKISSNPNVWMTALAILVNFFFYNQTPTILQNVLHTFSNAFQSMVLFLLGICVVGVGKTKSQQSLVIALLLVMKILVTPLATRGAVQLFCSDATDKRTLQDYGFLYGTIPTAPVVLLYAIEFGIPTEMLAAALVLCTLISGPVMYVSTRMITVQIFTIMQYVEQLRETLFYISIISLVSSIWVGLILLMNGWWRRPPHSIVGYLLLSQIIMSVGVLSWTLTVSGTSWSIYLQILSITGGLLSGRFWTALLAITIMLMHRHTQITLSFMKCYYLLFGFGIPAAIVSGLMLINGLKTGQPTISYKVPSFIYGPSQAYASLVVLSFCLVTTIICLVMFSRDKQIGGEFETKIPDIVRKLSIIKEELPPMELKDVVSGKVKRENNNEIAGPSSERMSLTQQQICCKNVPQVKNPFDSKELKILPHIILLLLQCISMVVGITVTIWRLLADDHSGIYIAIEFLDVVLTFGQGFYCLAVYGSNTTDIVQPVLKLVTKFNFALKNFRTSKEVDDKTFVICSQFLCYHYQRFLHCLKATEVPAECKFKKTFQENELVMWLTKERVVKDKVEGIAYVKHLCTGGILIHESQKQVADSSNSYYFCPNMKQKEKYYVPFDISSSK